MEGFAAGFLLHGTHKAKSHWKLEIEVAATAAHTSGAMPSSNSSWDRDPGWGPTCRLQARHSTGPKKQFIYRIAKHFLLHYVFNENGLSQNEDFPRIASFKTFFDPNSVALGLGFGIAFFPCLKTSSSQIKTDGKSMKTG